jgi:uncharacterized protein (TIGR02300 family)
MPELGKKYECAECGAKFYDLGKSEAICPRCGTNQKDVERATPEPRTRYVAPKAPAPAVVEPEEDEPVEGIVDEDDEILEVEPGEEEEEEEEEDEE